MNLIEKRQPITNIWYKHVQNIPLWRNNNEIQYVSKIVRFHLHVILMFKYIMILITSHKILCKQFTPMLFSPPLAILYLFYPKYWSFFYFCLISNIIVMQYIDCACFNYVWIDLIFLEIVHVDLYVLQNHFNLSDESHKNCFWTIQKLNRNTSTYKILSKVYTHYKW